MYFAPNTEYEKLKALLDPIDLSEVLSACIECGDNDQYSVAEAIKVKVPEVADFYSDDILLYLMWHYNIEAEVINYQRIHASGRKVEKMR